MAKYDEPFEYVMVDYARYFAIGAHGDQRRKYTFEPYYKHLDSIHDTLIKWYPHIDAYIVGYLHDVVEDTIFTSLHIQEYFGERIGRYVSELTEPPKEFGNRKQRKAYYHAQLVDSSPLAQTVKYADIIDNCTSICEHDPDFALVFCYEVGELLCKMDKGDKQLYLECYHLVSTSYLKVKHDRTKSGQEEVSDKAGSILLPSLSNS